MRQWWWTPLAIAAALAGVPARAGGPDIWERAATPRLSNDMRVYREVQNLLWSMNRATSDVQSKLAVTSVAARMLESADAAGSPDVRVRILYARVLQELSFLAPNDRNHERARTAAKILEGVIAQAADDPEVIDAYFVLAITYARLGEPLREVAVYEALLERETSSEARATVLCNQAEAYMVAGDLERSVPTYRASLSINPGNALTHWGLAVALDRWGDHGGAVEAAAMALRYDPDASQLNDEARVFFVPAYDRFWYRALGAEARAKAEPDPGVAMLLWNRAASTWAEYIEAATIGDRWLHAARVRRAACERKEAQLRAEILRQQPKAGR